VCGKIYFSRHPIALLALSPRNFHICADCSAVLSCSRCNQLISPEATLVVENNSRDSLEFFCSSCRDTVIIGSGALLKGIRARFGMGTQSYLAALSHLFRRIIRREIWPGRRRTKH
jgi:hypothetical protein